MTRTPDGARTTPRVEVLGPIVLRDSGKSIRLSELERGLLAAAAGRDWIGGATLEEWLWGDHAPTSARNRVQSLVSGLRRKVDASVLVTEDSGYRLADDVQVDLDEWKSALELARDGADLDDIDRVDALARAVAEFGNQPLHGAPSTPPVDAERHRLTDQWLEVVEAEIAMRLAGGQLDGLPTRLSRLTADHPFHEGLLAQYVLCLGAVGQQHRALEVYRETRERLVDELGVEPSERLRSAHHRVLNGEVDAGVHDRAPTSQAPAWSAAPVPRTLPRAPADFVGRSDVLARIRAAAARAAQAPVVVSLSGLSGAGTSAVAAVAGAAVGQDFPDGSLYLDASHLGAEQTVHAAVGTMLGMLGVPSVVVPDDQHARTGLYRSVLGERRVLVVLDNVDHADGIVSPGLRDLLPTSPGSLAIVTSRTSADDLDPTVQLRLGSLDAHDAIALLERAGLEERVRDEPEAVAELVRLTGGLPLSLRLVASRLASRPDLTIRALVTRLENGAGTAALDPTAAASLSTSVALVWDRLPEAPRRAAAVMAQLPFHTVSAWVPQVLLGPDHDGERAIDALVDACFVEPVLRDGRLPQYRLHDAVARHARDHAPDDLEPDTVLERVASALLGHLVAHHHDLPLQFIPAPPVPHDVTVERAAELTRDERRLVNATELPFVAACARSLVERGRATGLAWRLVVACDNARGIVVSDDDWLDTIETVRSGLGDDPDAVRGGATLDIVRAWHLQDLLGHSAPALELATAARAVLDPLEAPQEIIAAGLVSAYAALSLADRPRAEQELAEVEAALSQSANLVQSGWSFVVRGELLNDFDDLAACEHVLGAGRAILATTPERIGFARATTYLSRALARQGRWESARDLADQALGILGEHGAERPATIALDARAEIAVGLGDSQHAAELAGVALERARSSRDEFLLARTMRTLARANAAQGRWEEAVRGLRESVDRFEGIRRPLSVAATWRELALVLDRLHRPDDAAAARRRQAESEQTAASQPSSAEAGSLQRRGG